MSEQPSSLNQALLKAIDTYPAFLCLKVKQGPHYQNISYRQFYTHTLQLAAFFHQRGITNGQRVALIADNSKDWLAVHIASLFAGNVVVPLRTSLPPDILFNALKDSGATVALVQRLSQKSSVIEQAGNSLPDLKIILTIEETANKPPHVTGLPTLLSRSLTSSEQQSLRNHAEQVDPQALSTIFYVGSETGQPKGATFTHAQRLQTLQCMAAWFTLTEDDLAFTLLPWSFSASLNAALYYFVSGVTNVLGESPETVQENLQQTSPTLTLNMPFFIQRYYEEVMQSVAQMPQASREVFQWAVAKGKELRAAGADATKELQERFNQADMTFFSQIRGSVGGRLRRLYSVGAPLPQELADFVEVLGLLPLNLYSITEAGGFPAVSQPNARQPNSCGRAAPGFQIRIAADGEVLVKGPTLMQGFWQRPQESQQIIDADGWLHTGDIGYLDQAGYLYLTGRKDMLMVLSTGRKVLPGRIEQSLTASPFIEQAAVFGEGRPYISALIVPNLEKLVNFFQEKDILPANDSDATTLKWYWQQDDPHDTPLVTTAHPKVKILLDEAVESVNQNLDLWEQIQVYSLLEQAHSKAANELATLLSQGRPQLAQRYALQIEAMYPQSQRVKIKEIKRVQLSPERLRELLEKENILDAWMADAGIEFLFELARGKQIDAPSMVHLCDIAASIAQMVNEERPLSTALIVGDPIKIARTLPPSQIQLLRHDYIRRARRILMTLAKIVDGLTLGFVVDKHGYLRGIHRLNVSLDEPPLTYLLGPQFRRHAAISAACDAVVFFVPSGGKQVRVFANGELIGRYSNGDWSPESMFRVGDAMAQLIEKKDYDLPLVRRILRCALQMAEENLGAIFIIGNADKVLEQSDSPEISHFAWIVSASLNALSDDELINFAKQDGATVIDMQGQFRGCMVLLRPNADTQADIGPGKGARHSSAAKMSAEADCLAIAVSQDGPVTIYEGGQRVLSL